jgi:hypothetical protein
VLDTGRGEVANGMLGQGDWWVLDTGRGEEGHGNSVGMVAEVVPGVVVDTIAGQEA